MGYLSDIARRRIAALLLLAGIAAVVLAVTDTGPFDDPPTEGERVAETVERFIGAAAAGDFEAYCALLTASARDRVQANAARLIEEAGRLPCPDILSLAAKAFADATVRIREVSVSGNRARVEANVRLPGAAGADPKTMFLEQSAAGEWRVSDPG